ncbi:hypothetical protein [Pararhizobium gei]|uniref:hypothetical protein n=1 Tax=Pararhizobium gei TaxID=1395951 RepID=UPI0023DBE069|nr:hypothetical protein [Rhizobium gei]
MNMLHVSVRPGSEKARIWQICDELFARKGEIPSGREVVNLYLAEDGKEGTGFTQYSHWKKELQSRMQVAGDQQEQGEPQAMVAGAVAFRPITISPDGHLIVPADMRRAMMLDGDGRATASVVDGELRIISPLAALSQLQRRTQDLVPRGSLVSDELIAERRAEAQAE